MIALRQIQTIQSNTITETSKIEQPIETQYFASLPLLGSPAQSSSVKPDRFPKIGG
jgi:hypothetical protein